MSFTLNRFTSNSLVRRLSVRPFATTQWTLKPTSKVVESEQNYKVAAVSLFKLRNMISKQKTQQQAEETQRSSSSSSSSSSPISSRSKAATLLGGTQVFANLSHPSVVQKRFYTYILPLVPDMFDAAEYDAYGSADYQEPESIQHQNCDWYGELDDVSGQSDSPLSSSTSVHPRQPSVRGGDGEVYTVS